MRVYKTIEHARMPEFATSGSACFDLRAVFEEGEKTMCIRFDPYNKKNMVPLKILEDGTRELRMYPGFKYMIPTGLIFSIPKGHMIKIFARSGLAVKKSLVLANHVGIIDADYVEPVFIVLANESDSVAIIKEGDRIAQGKLEKTLNYTFEETKRHPANVTGRDGGFGSTGVS